MISTSLTSRQKAFTIVELLVVIVVIGVLASISVVGFRGVQQRAAASAANTNAESWKKLLSQYALLHGNLNDNLNGGPGANYIQFCLDTPSKAEGHLPVGACGVWINRPGEDPNPDGAINFQRQNNPAALLEIETKLGTKLPSGATPMVTMEQNTEGWGRFQFRGINYTSYSSTASPTDTPNSLSNLQTLNYYLPGNASCGSFTKAYLAEDNASRYAIRGGKTNLRV